MTDATPYAYLTWRCSVDGSDLDQGSDGRMTCETCGHTFEVSNALIAPMVPECEDCGEIKENCSCDDGPE